MFGALIIVSADLALVLLFGLILLEARALRREERETERRRWSQPGTRVRL